ncbi:MAG: hypothetical protein MUF00_00415 [Gemmatimonadaceae bacterium]|jgi:hypothetical protein|nr:hypothetical protein [Gemmatimonadaceae bacterium]
MITLLLALTMGTGQPDPLLGVRDPQLRTLAQTELRAAVQKGLPTAPLIAKTLEGQLKQAPAPRIAMALKALTARMELVKTKLGSATEPELVAGADALAAGVSPDALAALRRMWPERSIALPIGVLTELVTRGVEPKLATREVINLLNRRATPQQLIQLGYDVSNDVRRGQGAHAALDVRVRGLMGSLLPAPAGSTAIPARP